MSREKALNKFEKIMVYVDLRVWRIELKKNEFYRHVSKIVENKSQYLNVMENSRFYALNKKIC